MEEQSKSSVLLTELIIVMLFFALIAVTVVQMFVMSNQKGRINAYTQRALIAAQDWAEALSGQPDPDQALIDAGFVPSRDGSGSYQRLAEGDALRIEVRVAPAEQTAAGRLVGAEIRVVYTKDVRDPNRVLATLPVSSYIPGY